MKKSIVFVGMLFLSVSFYAQKTIVLSDSLAANSDRLPVKMGAQWFGKITKFKFGDYEVASSKMGWGNTTTRGNLFNTKTQSKSTQKFSFILAGAGTDNANVNAASNIESSEVHGLELFNNFTIGTDATLRESNNFSAYIRINNDTTDGWALLMHVVLELDKVTKAESLLTNGTRKIYLYNVTSNDKGEDDRKYPAMGYELREDGKAVAAVQFYGGGLMGTNKNIIWLTKDASPAFRLMLAAALTAVLQDKANAMAF